MFVYTDAYLVVTVTRCILFSSSRIGSVNILKARDSRVFLLFSCCRFGTYEIGSTEIFGSEMNIFLCFSFVFLGSHARRPSDLV